MMGDVDEIIIQALSKGARTPEDLKRECVTIKGVNLKTYHPHLRKLVRRGEVRKIKEYRLIEEKQADLDEILDCLKRLKESNTDEVLEEVCIDLWKLCDGKRASYGKVLSFVETALTNPKFKNPKLLSKIIRSIYCLLHYENIRRRKDFEKIEQLKANIDEVGEILRVNRDPEVVGESMFFLGETGLEKAVDIIFNLVEIYSEEEFKNVEDSIKRGIFSYEWQLYKKFHKKINNKIYALAENSDPLFKKKGKRLLTMKHNIGLLNY